ncbi:hypothetical protein HYDPIDRAFT_82759 [Hydnomerulius pinastri MD-312]|nr:hypothetical protein HYDPIDRAFT_82759 [Hydnomerulius pinastri MD-312]
MPPRTVSIDLKARIPPLFQQGYSVKEICDLLDVKKSLVYKTLDIFDKLGVVSNPHKYSRVIGRQHILSQQDLAFIRATLDQKQTIYLDKLQDLLWMTHQVYASLPTLFRVIWRFQFSRKVVSTRAAECNDELRALYMNRIATKVPDPDMFMFVDEAAKDEQTTARKKGHSLKGVRCMQRR